MGKISNLIAVVVSLTLVAMPATAATKVFSMGGQSNMAGEGITAELCYPYNQTQAAVHFWSGNAWVDLGSGFGLRAGINFGPEVSFGYTIHHAVLPTDDIYLVKHGADGTSLAYSWRPDGTGGTEYATFKSKVDAAMNDLTKAGLSPTIAGMLWMQGEGD